MGPFGQVVVVVGVRVAAPRALRFAAAEARAWDCAGEQAYVPQDVGDVGRSDARDHHSQPPSPRAGTMPSGMIRVLEIMHSA